VRSLLVTILGALLVGGAVTASAWALESSTLPAPEPGDLAALNATAHLEQYRYVESSLRANGASVLQARCLTGWFPRRGELLRLGPRTTIADLGGHRLDVEGRLTADPVAYLLLAGCPTVLARTVDRLLQAGAKTTFARAWFARPAVSVKIDDKTAVLTLYLTPKRDALLGVRVVSPQVVGLSRIEPLTLTPARIELVEGRR
jgi:hypothetical protein